MNTSASMTVFHTGSRVRVVNKKDDTTKYHPLLKMLRATIIGFHMVEGEDHALIRPDYNVMADPSKPVSVPLEMLESITDKELEDELNGLYNPDYYGAGLSSDSVDLKAIYINEPGTVHGMPFNGYYALMLPRHIDGVEDVVAKAYIEDNPDVKNTRFIAWTESMIEGKGYGTAVVHRAVEDMRTKLNTNVFPICPFASITMQKHPLMRRHFKDMVLQQLFGALFDKQNEGEASSPTSLLH